MAENGAVQNELTLRQIVDGISALLAVLTPATIRIRPAVTSICHSSVIS
jgi:hypothetical protein